MPNKMWYTFEKVLVKVGQLVTCWYKIADSVETRLALEVSEIFARNGNVYLWGTCVSGDRNGQSMTLDVARVLEMDLIITDIQDFKPVPLKAGLHRFVTAGHFRVFGFVEDVTELAMRSAKRRGGNPIDALRIPVATLLLEVLQEKAEPEPEPDPTA